MTNHERRHSVALDECFNYCRLLEGKAQQPQLYKLCNAIRTLDLALAGEHEDSPIPLSLCTEAWSKVRDTLFAVLVVHFAGRIEVVDDDGNVIEPGEDFPDLGTLHFYPDQISRRRDSYSAELNRLSLPMITVIRWCFAENRPHLEPDDFNGVFVSDAEEDKDDFDVSLEHMYEVCREEALEGKKKAHRKWWQLYWEASSCPNKRQRHQLRKQMVALEGIWGKPEK